MTNNLLEIKNLCVSFFTREGEVKAVDNISYEVANSQVVGIVGESGSGKSVSAMAAVGLIDKPGEILGGEIIFNQTDLTKLPARQMRNIRGKEIAFIFQDPMTCLNPLFTIGNQLREAIKVCFPDYSRKQLDERAQELLTLAGINEVEKRLKQYPHEFSGGMRQRAMIAMALAGNPKLLFADEPTTALDVTIQAQILDLLRDIQAKTKMSIVFITHDLGLINAFSDKVIVMYGGKIVEEAPTNEIFSNPRHPYTHALLDSLPVVYGPKRGIEPIKGKPIDLLNPPKGCPFAPRCNYCLKLCLNHMPDFFQTGENHKSACWLLHKNSPVKLGGAE